LLAVVLGATAMEAGPFAFEITPKGRLHVDYAAHDADLEPLNDDLLARRARLGLEAKFGEDWSFEIEYDFADLLNGDDFKFTEGGNVKDAYLRYDGWKPGAFTIGQFKVPFGLEELTSSNNITFIERALPIDTFALSRRIGVGFDRGGSKFTPLRPWDLVPPLVARRATVPAYGLPSRPSTQTTPWSIWGQPPRSRGRRAKSVSAPFRNPVPPTFVW